MKKVSHGLSHAKVIFLGEHSAVYGKPAIVFPVPKAKVEVTVTENSNEKIIINSNYFNGNLNDAPIKLAGIKALVLALYQDLNLTGGITLSFESLIPLGRGMGSSAAIATAITRALFAYADCELTDIALKHYTDIEENITHGNPSGIDAQTVASQTPILFEQHHFYQFPLSLNGDLIIADTGVSGNTKEAVDKVKSALTKNPEKVQAIIDDLGTLVETAKDELAEGDLDDTGRLLDAAQTDLANLGVSTPKIDKLINVAKENGAIGAKLTGSGLGGCIIAVADNSATTKNIEDALLANGATQVWIQSLTELQPKE